MKLYSYFRSSAVFRVRIALNLKGLPYDIVPVHLLKDGGQQLTPAYRALNRDGLVPTLVTGTDQPHALTQSLAIIEYLEETCPQPPLLPVTPLDRAHVRALALSIACDIHPMNNLRVVRYLVKELGASETAKDAWYRHWCQEGLEAVEATLAADARTGKFCLGDTPSMADCCLVPQVGNALRVGCDMSSMPTIMRINQTCLALDAFANAAPDRQLDAE